MRFDVETSQDYGVGIGAIFLDDNGYPCIKIPDVRSCYDFDIYNCIRLSDGKPSHFQWCVFPLPTALRLISKKDSRIK